MKKRDYLFSVLAFMLMIYICLICTIGRPFDGNGDTLFLWNRAKQVYNCLLDGKYPFFYYNDFTGVGHGSSFFYGQLTLLPFIPLVAVGIKEFMMSYILTFVVLSYFGVCSLAKRFTSDYRFVGLLYLSSSLFVQLTWYNVTYSCYLAIAIAFFFLAQCVDVFRDGKSCLRASLLFLLIFNTHTITTLMAFIGCVLLFIYYFNFKQIKKYLEFAGLTLCLCSYNIINYISHMDCLRDLDTINANFNFFSPSTSQCTLSPLVFGGGIWTFLYSLIFGEAVDVGMRICNLSVALVLIICMIKGFKTVRHIPLYLLSIFGIVLGIRHSWSYLFEYWKVPIQFPIRYLPFLFVFLLILCVRNFKSSVLKVLIGILVTVDIFVFGMIGVEPAEKSWDSFEMVGNGEYLSDNFIFDKDIFTKYSKNVIGNDGAEYSYEIDKDKLIVNLETNTSSTITVPKLYYNGYSVVDTEGNPHGCYEGYSMFTEINVNGFKGTLIVQYQHPMYLVLLLCFVYLVSISVFIVDIINSIRNRKKV